LYLNKKQYILQHIAQSSRSIQEINCLPLVAGTAVNSVKQLHHWDSLHTRCNQKKFTQLFWKNINTCFWNVATACSTITFLKYQQII